MKKKIFILLVLSSCFNFSFAKNKNIVSLGNYYLTNEQTIYPLQKLAKNMTYSIEINTGSKQNKTEYLMNYINLRGWSLNRFSGEYLFRLNYGNFNPSVPQLITRSEVVSKKSNKKDSAGNYICYLDTNYYYKYKIDVNASGFIEGYDQNDTRFWQEDLYRITLSVCTPELQDMNDFNTSNQLQQYIEYAHNELYEKYLVHYAQRANSALNNSFAYYKDYITFHFRSLGNRKYKLYQSYYFAEIRTKQFFNEKNISLNQVIETYKSLLNLIDDNKQKNRDKLEYIVWYNIAILYESQCLFDEAIEAAIIAKNINYNVNEPSNIIDRCNNVKNRKAIFFSNK